MLALTDEAAAAIRDLTSQPELPDRTGLRISTTVGNDGEPTFGLSVAPNPEPEDQVVESDGARVYLDSDVASVLDEMTLDAQISEHGQVQFRFFAQGP